MEPPWPVNTGSTPHASAKARRATSATGPSKAMVLGSPVSPSSDAELRAPGRVRVQVLDQLRRGGAGVVPGASRRLIFARATGARVLEARSTGVASSAMTETAGLHHSRSTTVPVPICSTPSSSPDSARSRSSG